MGGGWESHGAPYNKDIITGVSELVRKRILNGSYSLKVFPSERRLADELSVNYMTVRRGLQ